MIKLKQIKGKEFVKKVLQGERDFSRIRLEDRFNLGGYKDFEEMQEYLKNQDLSINPVIIEYSYFKYLKATGLYLPFVKGKGVHFYASNLHNVNFRKAEFPNSAFYASFLIKTDLTEANLSWASFYRSKLDQTDFSGADIRQANFFRASNTKKAIFKDVRKI